MIEDHAIFSFQGIDKDIPSCYLEGHPVLWWHTQTAPAPHEEGSPSEYEQNLPNSWYGLK